MPSIIDQTTMVRMYTTTQPKPIIEFEALALIKGPNHRFARTWKIIVGPRASDR